MDPWNTFLSYPLLFINMLKLLNPIFAMKPFKPADWTWLRPNDLCMYLGAPEWNSGATIVVSSRI